MPLSLTGKIAGKFRSKNAGNLNNYVNAAYYQAKLPENAAIKIPAK